MNFVSPLFFLFAAAVVLLYYVLPRRCQWMVLLEASAVFCATYGAEDLVFILASVLTAYLSARRIEKLREEGGAAARTRCKGTLIAAAGTIIGLLVLAKAGGSVMAAMTELPLTRQLSSFNLIALVGVSYYTLSLLSYVADVYWKRDRAETSFPRLLLFAVYFPKVLQGPISRHKNLAPQFWQAHSFDYKEFCFGLQLMLWGYFKKMVIADRLAVLVNQVFGNHSGYPGSVLLAAAAGGAIQLYCDFSGCMDIAGGLSQVLGIKLERNFDHPFFSGTAAEFWRRWHITLGSWFKDYVYMPLLISPELAGAGKELRRRFGVRAGKAFMTAVPLLAVWLLTGLWHGTGWNYIAWGIYWGALIACSNIFAPEIKKITKLLRIDTQAASWRLFQAARTFVLFVVGRILTIPGDLRASRAIFRKIFFEFNVSALVDGTLYTLGLGRPDFILAMVCIFVLWSVSMLQKRGSLREQIAGSNIVFRWGVYYIAVFSALIFGMYGPGYDPSSFIYMQF